ncbi:retrovirus-related pol polyprotein from transposon TNT 1-94, partial [Tanacetum coccineum]
NLKESFGNNPSTPARDTPDFDSAFVIRKIKASLQGKDNVINKLKTQISHLQETHSEADRTLDFRALDFQITQLTEKVTVLQEQNEPFRAKNAKIKQHYKELYDSMKITRAKHIEQATALTTENENLKAQIQTKMKSVTKDHVKPIVLAPGVNYSTNASGSQPKSNTKKNKISPAKGVNKKKVEEHPRTNKSNLRITNPVDSSSSSKRTIINSNFDSVCQTCNKCLISANHDMCVVDYLQSVKAPPSIHNSHNVVRKVKQVWKPKQVRKVWKPTGKVLTSVIQIVLWYLDSGYSKYMTGDRSRLRNFVEKFIETVRFGNDHFCAIMGYEDYVIGDKVAFRKHTCYVQDTDSVDLIKGSRGLNSYTISVEDMMKSSPIFLMSKASKNKSWLWHRCLNHLNFGTINDLARKDLVRGLPRLKFKKDYLSSACQLGKSKKHTYKPKPENTNLEVLNTLYMDLCGPVRVQLMGRNTS